MLKQGDTFLLDRHLFVIISDPSLNSQRIVLAAFTTYESHRDHSCILSAGEHEFVRHDTCVSYDFLPDMTIPAADIDRMISSGAAKQMEGVNNEILARILAGAEETERIHYASWDELNKQGLVD